MCLQLLSSRLPVFRSKLSSQQSLAPKVLHSSYVYPTGKLCSCCLATYFFFSDNFRGLASFCVFVWKGLYTMWTNGTKSNTTTSLWVFSWIKWLNWLDVFSLNIEDFVIPVSFFYINIIFNNNIFFILLTRGEVCFSVNSKQDRTWFLLIRDWRHVKNLHIVCFDVRPPLLHPGEDLSGQNQPVFDCFTSSQEAMNE